MGLKYFRHIAFTYQLQDEGEKYDCQERRPEEFSRIYDLVKVAFQTAKFSDGKEQDFVKQLRASGNYIPELALVAEESGQLIGHIIQPNG